MSEILDVDRIIKTLLTGKPNKKGKILKKSEIETLCRKASAIFLSQPTLLELEAPLKVCGDIHGQFTDLLKLFGFGGYPPVANYLFLGDYVDRGQQSLETICLLLAYKVKYPENFFLLRGNHEVASVCRVYGFFDECKRRYNIKIFKTFTDVFNTLPVAALIDDKIFCCHGGLSPDLLHMSQVSNIKRPTDVPQSGLLCDLLWSDPSPDPGWAHNDRGVSFTFGEDVVHKFLQKHNLDLICRGHMVVEDGYEFFANRRLVTVFSAPNYCGEFDNAGALMSVNEELLCSFQILTPVKTPGNNSVQSLLKTLKSSGKKAKFKEPPIPAEDAFEFLEAAKRLRKVDLNKGDDVQKPAPSSGIIKRALSDSRKITREIEAKSSADFASSSSPEFLGKLNSLKAVKSSPSSSSSLTVQKKLTRSTEDLSKVGKKDAEFLGAFRNLKKTQEAPDERGPSSSNYFAKDGTPEFLQKARGVGLRRVQSARIPDMPSRSQSGVFRNNTSSEEFDKHVEETITKVKQMAEVYQMSQKRF